MLFKIFKKGYDNMIKETIIMFVCILLYFSLISLLYTIKDKVKTDGNSELLNIIIIIIESCVISTNQTYVNELKQLGKFDKASQKIAFENTKDNIINILESVFNVTKKIDGTITSINGIGIDDVFINNKIEEFVSKYKNK